MKQFIKYLPMACLGFSNGCFSSPPPAPAVTSPPAVQHLVHQIKLADIQMIQQGDRLTVIIPTDKYFEPLTTTIKEERQTNLRAMSQFVKNFSDSYPRSVIRVTGFTDQVFSHQTQRQLSKSYAEAIAAYLFNAGIDPRRIAIQGLGSSEPIAGQTAPRSAALNRRVVIQIN